MRLGLIQLNGSDAPQKNLAQILKFVGASADDGAEFVMTPEVSNFISTDKGRQAQVLRNEAEDESLPALKEAARGHGIWLLIGSLALRTDAGDGRFVNRSFLISPQGEIAARYDKIHMFDVDLGMGERYRESTHYQNGKRAVLADMGCVKLGMTICYDIRFPHLYRDLALAGAGLIAVPSAMSPITGPAHIETLLRARAIETGCFLAMPSQTGQHEGRATWGHSMVVSPWGEVLLNMGTDPGFACLDLDLSMVEKVQRQIPSLKNSADYEKP